MIRINDILDRITDYQPEADLELIERAYIYTARAHEGQTRLSGEPYLSHPLEVAGILAEMKLDVVSIAAGLLHDVIEDTNTTEAQISEMFGPEVCHIVSGITKLSILPTFSAQARQAESIRRMILAMADDLRVIFIKLADRIHNMRTLKYHKPAKQVAIAQETLDIYAPIASRLGIFWIKNELENLSFQYTHAEEYQRITEMVAKSKVEREEYIQMVKTIIRDKMAEADLECEILGRFKQFYSIYNKMISQQLEFEEVYDIIAFRIILDTVPQCYEALGILHALWKPITGKFKDYIGVPKPNMYQSLHTTVIGPRGERVEIQIRTHEMDRVAKSGIAAHWGYKEGKKIDPQDRQRFAWIQDLVENQESFHSPDEFLENLRIDLFPDEVYVFTPRGDIKSLPKGATPVDFAYEIHTEVGHQCTGAKVNGRMVSLQHPLSTGDIVEVISTKGHQPSKDWLNFVKTVKARSRIRQWIKTQEKDRSLSLGREMLEKAFRKQRLNYNTEAGSDKMENVVSDFGFKTADDLITNVGYGKITPLQVVRKFMAKPEAADDTSLINKLIGRYRKKKDKSGVIVKGLDDILIRFGKCCQPVPGDMIVGYVTHGQGVTVHRTNCVNALKMNPERQIDVAWNQEIKESYPVKIRIRTYDRVGLLADITASISKNNASILSMNAELTENKIGDCFMRIIIEDVDHLNRVLADVRKIKMVQDVRRVG